MKLAAFLVKLFMFSISL